MNSSESESGETADAPDLGSGGATRGGSSPPSRTIDYECSAQRNTLKETNI